MQPGQKGVMKSILTLPALLATTSLAACATAGPSPATFAPPATTMPSAPLDVSAPVTRIAFGSCNKQYGRQDHWAAIAATDPDLFVYLGDNVYGDVRTDDPSVPELRAAYYQLARSKEFSAFRGQTPILAIWDDHDYGLNDAGAEFELKEASEALFEDVWALPEDDPRREREGVYHAVTVGEDGQRVQIILLDTRFHRSALTKTPQRGAVGRERYVPSTDDDQTMLGAGQETWLAETLEAPADLRILVTTVQLMADGHGWEAWATLPKARARLYDQLAEAQSGGAPILVVSGDRHRGGLYRAQADGETFTEMTASSLNASFDGDEEPGPNRLGPTVTAENFGLIEIDWSGGAAEMVLLGTDGQRLQRTLVGLE